MKKKYSFLKCLNLLKVHSNNNNRRLTVKWQKNVEKFEIADHVSNQNCKYSVIEMQY